MKHQLTEQEERELGRLEFLGRHRTLKESLRLMELQRKARLAIWELCEEGQ